MPTLQNSQTHPNNPSAIADKLFECVWPFCGIGVLRVKKSKVAYIGSVMKNCLTKVFNYCYTVILSHF